MYLLCIFIIMYIYYVYLWPRKKCKCKFYLKSEKTYEIKLGKL